MALTKNSKLHYYKFNSTKKIFSKVKFGGVILYMAILLSFGSAVFLSAQKFTFQSNLPSLYNTHNIWLEISAKNFLEIIKEEIKNGALANLNPKETNFREFSHNFGEYFYKAQIKEIANPMGAERIFWVQMRGIFEYDFRKFSSNFSFWLVL